MIQPYRLIKSIKYISGALVLLFALVGLPTAIPSTHAAASAVPSTTFSSNWSGYEATAPLGSFKKSQCAFKVPAIKSSGDVSAWCGLGGDPNSVNPTNPTQGAKDAVLVQAGMDACLNSNSCTGNCTRNVQCNSLWWEIADALVVQPIRFNKKIAVGDSIYVYVESNLHNNGTDIFFLQDRTTHESHKIIATRQGVTKDGQPTRIVGPQNGFPIVSDGGSAECIVERPLNVSSNTFVRLTTFKSVTIFGCDDGRVNQAQLESIASVPTVTKINMFNPANSGSNSPASNSAKQAAAGAVVVIAAPTGFSGLNADNFTVIQPTNPQPQGKSNSIAHFIDIKPG